MTKTRLLRPLAAVGTGLALAVGGVMVTASPASADTPGCVTKTEYRKVHKGMIKKRVDRIFDIPGEFVDAVPVAGGFFQAYGTCKPGHFVGITYKRPRHGLRPVHVYKKGWFRQEG
jgi:hypothetical protein